MSAETPGKGSRDAVDSCCSNIVDLASVQARQRRVLAWVFGINVVTFAMMVAGSVMSGSSALLSGTLDNLGDALTYALSMAVVGASAQAKARVAVIKGLLILGAALAVAVQIAWRLTDLDAPAAGTMSVAAVLNLVANAVCLKLLTPYRDGDVNMSSSWECSRNDVIEGLAVIGAAAAVWAFASPWPDLIVALVLLVIFLRSATRGVEERLAGTRTRDGLSEAQAFGFRAHHPCASQRMGVVFSSRGLTGFP